MTLTFEIQHDPDWWYLDNVSIYHGATQLLINGGFETGSLSPWTVTSSPSGCSSGAGSVVSSPCSYGVYCYKDGCKFGSDFLRQQFNVMAGELYVISFFLQLGVTGSVAFINVTLS